MKVKQYEKLRSILSQFDLTDEDEIKAAQAYLSNNFESIYNDIIAEINKRLNSEAKDSGNTESNNKKAENEDEK